MTALALLGIGPDATLEDRLEAARAAQSWPAAATAICLAILVFWLVSRLGDDEADVAPAASGEPADAERMSRPSVPTHSGVRVAPHVPGREPDASRAA